MSCTTGLRYRDISGSCGSAQPVLDVLVDAGATRAFLHENGANPMVEAYLPAPLNQGRVPSWLHAARYTLHATGYGLRATDTRYVKYKY